MTLSSIQHMQLQKALLSAFPGYGALEQMVKHQLDQNLAAVAGGSNLSETVFHLINWAESNGRIEELITKARKENPGNPHLRAFAERFPPITRGHDLLSLELQAIGDKYLPELYAERPIDETAHTFLQTASRLLLVVDSAGSGKTSLCCHLAQQVVGERSLVFINCGQIDDVFREIDRQLVLLTGHRLADPGMKPLIILDAINEFDRPPIMRNSLALLLKQLPSDAQCLMTCRDVSWPYFKPYEEDSLQPLLFEGRIHSTGSFSSDVLNHTFLRYFQRYKIDAEIRGQARTSMAHPLLMRFFCEAYAGERLGRVRELYLKDLFETYLVRKRSEMARRSQLAAPQAVDEFLEAVARVLWVTEGPPMPEAFSQVPHGGLNPSRNSLYGRILETEILVEREHETTARRISFKYEAFQDFIVARILRRDLARVTGSDRPSLQAAADLIAEQPRKPALETVAGFLFAMIRDKRDLGILDWEPTSRRHPNAVIHALRQVPADKLLRKELRVLVSLVDSDDRRTKLLAMDCVADRYAYLPSDLQNYIKSWLDTGYPELTARLVVENFDLTPETGWSAVWNLLERDITLLSDPILLEFAIDLIQGGDISPELKRLLGELKERGLSEVGSEAGKRLDFLDGTTKETKI